MTPITPDPRRACDGPSGGRVSGPVPSGRPASPSAGRTAAPAAAPADDPSVPARAAAVPPAAPPAPGATDAAAPPPETLPNWLPDDARLYLAHVEGGVPLRALARSEGCHASTILRRVRRTEARRDDPLVDAALARLASRMPAPSLAAHDCVAALPCRKDSLPMTAPLRTRPPMTHAALADDETLRLLRRMAEPGACLALAEGMDKAVIMRGNVRTAILDSGVAEAFALKEWIAPIPAEPGAPRSRIARYRLTGAGRTQLRALLADRVVVPSGCLPRAGDFAPAQPVHAEGMAEAAAAYRAAEGLPGDLPDDLPAEGLAHKLWGERVLPDPEDGRRRRMRVNLAESPLTALARRRDRDGTPFLSEDLVIAGERLREDFELAQIGPRVAQNWERFLTGGGDRGQFRASDIGSGGSDRARARVASALRDLGPGLGDMVLRVCCFLEGVEAAEQKLGWSARSGKIVLRIALMRLKRHYEDNYGGASPLIG